MKDVVDFTRIEGPEENAWANFESLCANLIERRFSNQSVARIRGNPGDHGIDIIVGSVNDPAAIFQCKYFLRSIGPTQRKQIKDSFARVRSRYYPRSWTLITPIDASIDDRDWFEQEFPVVNPGEVRRWWGKTNLISLISEYRDVGDTYFDLDSRRRIRELHEFVVERPESLDDSSALQMVYLYFDRPAFRLGFENEASIPDFRQAMEDTLEALNLGVLSNRRGVARVRSKPRSAFNDPVMKQAMETATVLIEEITVKLARAIEQGIFTRYRDHETIWVFDANDHRAMSIANEMNDLRNEVIRAMNVAFEQADAPLLPEITDRIGPHGYIGRSNHHFRADADHVE